MPKIKQQDTHPIKSNLSQTITEKSLDTQKFKLVDKDFNEINPINENNIPLLEQINFNYIPRVGESLLFGVEWHAQIIDVIHQIQQGKKKPIIYLMVKVINTL